MKYNGRFDVSLRRDIMNGVAACYIIRECRVEELGDWQEHYILEYDTYFNGWNKTLGMNYERTGRVLP